MVLKKSKFGGNTGNTLRRVAGCSKKGTSLKASAFVTMNKKNFDKGEDNLVSNNKEPYDIKHKRLFDLSEFVQYSINKKKIWEVVNEDSLCGIPVAIQERNGYHTFSIRQTKKKKLKNRTIFLNVPQDDESKMTFTVDRTPNTVWMCHSQVNAKRNNNIHKEMTNKFYGSRKKRKPNYLDDYYLEDPKYEDSWSSYEDDDETMELEEKRSDQADQCEHINIETRKHFKTKTYCIDALREINSTRTHDLKTNFMCTCFVVASSIDSSYLANRCGRYFTIADCTPHQFCIFDKNFFKNFSFLTVKIIDQNTHQSKIELKLFNTPSHLISYFAVENENDVLDFELLLYLCFNPILCNGTDDDNTLTIKDTVNTNRKPKCSVEIMNRDDVWFNNICLNRIFKEGVDDDVASECSICTSICNITSLNSCGHYLCDDCWGEYINAKVSSGLYNVICPEPECNVIVDSITLLTYLREELVKTFVSRSCDVAIQKAIDLQVCPTPDCPRVASCRSFNKDCLVKCSCNESWCFSCLKTNHWPATCEALEQYEKEKRESGVKYDEFGNIVSEFAAVKKCPTCRSLIEKDGGCEHMFCLCGSQFCWRCTTKLKEEAEIHKCRDVSEAKIYFDKKNLNYSVSWKKTFWYKKAEYFEELVNITKASLRIKMRSKFINDEANDLEAKKVVVQKHLENSIRIEATNLLIEHYEKLQYICIENAHHLSKHKSRKSKKYLDDTTRMTSRLYRRMNTNSTERFGEFCEIRKVMNALKLSFWR